MGVGQNTAATAKWALDRLNDEGDDELIRHFREQMSAASETQLRANEQSWSSL